MQFKLNISSIWWCGLHMAAIQRWHGTLSFRHVVWRVPCLYNAFEFRGYNQRFFCFLKQIWIFFWEAPIGAIFCWVLFKTSHPEAKIVVSAVGDAQWIQLHVCIYIFASQQMECIQWYHPCLNCLKCFCQSARTRSVLCFIFGMRFLTNTFECKKLQEVQTFMEEVTHKPR